MSAENLALTEIRSPDVQPVGSRYTNCAIPAHVNYIVKGKVIPITGLCGLEGG